MNLPGAGVYTVSQISQQSRENEWLDYYRGFSYFEPEKIRAGCQPRIMEHPGLTEKAIILVHGLCDSPYFMSAIGDYFHNALGYNVYIPLLHCHGLKEPNGMEGVKLEQWKANVEFAVDTALPNANEISIGGLSTGGALSFYLASTKPSINGTLYLFSAALDLAGGYRGLIGELKERLLRTFIAKLLDSDKPLIGDNPYRYDHIDMDGARELAMLIKETDDIIDGYSKTKPFPKRVFAAHSECDKTADITGIESLQKVSISETFSFFRIHEQYEVSHAGLVLKDPIIKDGDILTEPNSQFPEMMKAITAFESID